MDQKLLEFSSADEAGLGVVDLSGYGLSSPKIQIASNNTTETLDDDRVWIQGSLTKFPPDVLTRGPNGIVEKKGLYVVFVKVAKGEDQAEYTTDAISDMLENHFKYNEKIELDNHLLTITKTYQQPNVAINGADQRYWNRIFVECEIYYKNN